MSKNLTSPLKDHRTKVKGPGIDESLLRPAHQWSASAVLSFTHPEIAAQWHRSKNGERTPDEFTYGSNEQVWWECPVAPDHVWKGPIKARTKRGMGCPFCIGRRASVTNNLEVHFPDIARELHPTKNGAITAKDIVSFTSKKVWWQCKTNPDHVWFACVSNRTHNGTGCPYCSGTAVSELNCLTVHFPELAKFWHPTKNGKLKPSDVSFKSQKIFWWRCPQSAEHVWQKNVASMTANINNRTHGCPFCSGRRLCRTNTLAYCHPNLAKEFHPSLNGDLTAATVYATRDKPLWWQCLRDKEHVWRASAYNRVKHGYGCPFCANRSWLVKQTPNSA